MARRSSASVSQTLSRRAGPQKHWRETLPNGASYETLDITDNGFVDNTQIYVVPAGAYFVLGDNRDNSQDSRIATHGYVPFDNVIGQVEAIFWSVNPNARAGAAPVRVERIGMRVR